MAQRDVRIPHNINIYAQLLFYAYQGGGELDEALVDAPQIDILRGALGDPGLFASQHAEAERSEPATSVTRQPAPARRKDRVNDLIERYEGVGLPHTCPKCQTTKAETVHQIVERFGLRERKLHDGSLRVTHQAWCKNCKRDARRSSK